MRRRWLLGALVTLLGVALIEVPAPVVAQIQTSSEERFFDIQWQVERAGDRAVAIVGTVRNHYLHSLQRVHVEAKVLDGGGQVIHETLAVIPDIPPGRRGTFRLGSPATGAQYVVTVHSFEFSAPQSP
jgi:hypothetical protein